MAQHKERSKKMNKFWEWSLEMKEKYDMYGFDFLLLLGIFIGLITIGIVLILK